MYFQAVWSLGSLAQPLPWRIARLISPIYGTINFTNHERNDNLARGTSDGATIKIQRSYRSTFLKNFQTVSNLS
jgi:hypothetical protein